MKKSILIKLIREEIQSLKENSKYAKLLLNISSESKSMKRKEFNEYISDYVSNPKEYGIKKNSEYYKALLWAKSDPEEAFEAMKEA